MTFLTAEEEGFVKRRLAEEQNPLLINWLSVFRNKINLRFSLKDKGTRVPVPLSRLEAALCSRRSLFFSSVWHTVRRAECPLLAQSGQFRPHQRLSAIGGTADIGDWGTRAHWNFAIDTSRDGAALRPTVASKNCPTLAFKSHNPALIGPAFDGTDRGVSKWCCARAPQSAALQFFLSIHPLQWPSWEPSMLIHILAE